MHDLKVPIHDATSSPSIALRPFVAGDGPRLIDWMSTSEMLLQWAGPSLRFPLDVGQLEQHISTALDTKPSARIYCAFDENTGQAIGHGELSGIIPEHRSARLTRVLIGPVDARGRGLGGQLVTELLRVAFDELQLHRVELNVFEENRAALRCYEKLGFRKEGLRRDTVRVGDRYWSAWMLAILEDEWHSAAERLALR